MSYNIYGRRTGFHSGGHSKTEALKKARILNSGTFDRYYISKHSAPPKVKSKFVQKKRKFRFF